MPSRTSAPSADHAQDREPAPSNPTSDLGDEGSLLVEEMRFAIVPEWVIDADIPDGAFRLYALLLRYGNGSGQRMPARLTLARRMHRSVDAVDRSMRQLVEAGMVRVEHRRAGRQFLSNRYHVRTSAPFASPIEAPPARGSRTSAATAADASGTSDRGRTDAARSGRGSEATPGRTSAATVAEHLRPDRETPTQRRQPPPPADSNAASNRTAVLPGTTVEVADNELLRQCGIETSKALDGLSRRCMDARRALGQPTGRWTPQCLTVAIRMAVVNRGWPASSVVPALLAVAADRATRSPVRLAEAGPWWDAQPDADTKEVSEQELAAAEARLADVGGLRVAVQARARAELTRERIPVTRRTVLLRAVAILDRAPSAARVADA
jgi:hypothetical protein